MKLALRAILLVVVTTLLAGFGNEKPVLSADPELTPRIRRPVAIAVADGRHLIVGNQRSGTISVVDATASKVVFEHAVGTQISDVTATSEANRFLATDQESHELIDLLVKSSDCRVEKRMPVSPYPVRVRVDKTGNHAFVASLWSRKLSIVDLKRWRSDESVDASKIIREISLPFSPREILVIHPDDQQARPSSVLPKQKLVVADAFGSKLAVVDSDSGEVDSVRDIPAHAIRGLQLHPTKSELWVSHQLLSGLAQSSLDDVHWGNLMVNVLRSLDLADLLNPQADLMKRTLLNYLGGPDRGAGDPAGFVMRPDGVTGVVISGTDELAIHDENHVYSGRVTTGHYPTAVALRPDGKQVYVLNTLSDSITVVQVSGPIVVGTISLGPVPQPTSIDRGELLFHSAKLSHDGWFSCASCHVDGHTNGLLTDNMTDGSFGTAKRVLTLRGVADTAPYAWSGRFPTLSDQISHSIRSTMQGEPISGDQIADIEAYLKSLPPLPRMRSHDQLAVERGAAIFEARNCRSCHALPSLTSPQIVDVGLKDERGADKFNPPSLRGVSQNAPYFHDGRAASLEAVFGEFRHQLDTDLSPKELRDLIAFLKAQ